MGQRSYFLAFDFAPLDHSWSSCCAVLAFASACFCVATSAFWRLHISFHEIIPARITRPHLCVSGDLLGVLFLGRHDRGVCRVGRDIDNEENAEVLVEGMKVTHAAAI